VLVVPRSMPRWGESQRLIRCSILAVAGSELTIPTVEKRGGFLLQINGATQDAFISAGPRRQRSYPLCPVTRFVSTRFAHRPNIRPPFRLRARLRSAKGRVPSPICSTLRRPFFPIIQLPSVHVLPRDCCKHSRLIGLIRKDSWPGLANWSW
jgi:hypothetical protein